jgi:hypothetical protein
MMAQRGSLSNRTKIVLDTYNKMAMVAAYRPNDSTNPKSKDYASTYY